MKSFGSVVPLRETGGFPHSSRRSRTSPSDRRGMTRVIELQVNGTTYRVDVDEETSLLSVLRDHLDLTGAKYGCGEGQCGACTVLIGGLPRRSCITRVGVVGDKPITTIEGLSPGGGLHPLQRAFLDADALQCGYCTSGMILTAAALLETTPHPTEREIAHFMEGNICRCGTYLRIIAAIRQAAKMLKEARS
jgi:aerobic-type carbon monoxide dehydrogenase small subunit (CoxS/CutS family)